MRFRLGQYEVKSIKSMEKHNPLLYQELRKKGFKYMVVNFDGSFVKYFRSFKEAKQFVLEKAGFKNEESLEQWLAELRQLEGAEEKWDC